MVSGRPPTLWWLLMTALGPLVGHGFDDVGVQGALGQVFRFGQLLGFFVEDVDEGVADDLALLLGIFHALEQVEEAILGLDEVEVQVESARAGR